MCICVYVMGSDGRILLVRVVELGRYRVCCGCLWQRGGLLLVSVGGAICWGLATVVQLHLDIVICKNQRKHQDQLIIFPVLLYIASLTQLNIG